MQAVTKLMIGFGIALSACTDTDSATNLVAEGPPMVRQVRMNTKVTNADGSQSTKRVFGFGTHELATADELQSNLVTAANAVNNGFRVIIDELLVGNNLEEIACRAPVDADAFSRVPVGATPDDVARCSQPDDVLPSTCGGPTAVCLCNIPGGCNGPTGLIAEGAPVGVLDINQDGATDDTQFIANSIGLRCDDIDVPINLEGSYWNPSGDQNMPAMGGFEALGPAVVLTPGDLTHGASLPTNTDCVLTADASVVDKQGVQLCAPDNGGTVVDGVYVADCNPGNLDAFHFTVEPLTVKPASFVDGGTGVSKTSSLVLAANAPLLATSAVAANITIKQNGTAVAPASVTLMMPQVLVVAPPTGGFAANATIELTITTTVTDTYNQAAPAAQVYTFTTGS
jgi:hypothetical protein